MAVLTPTAVNELNNVYEIATTDRVLGGELGVVNRQAQSLLNTCKYLDNRITTNANNIATHTNQISDLYSKSVPVGTIIMVAHNGVVPGYLFCDGSRISRTTYSALFGVIGTIYSVGNDSTTFNIPDFRGRYPRGYNYMNPVGTKIKSGLPNITGSIIRGNGMDDGALPTRVSGHGAFSVWSFSVTRGYGDSGANATGAYNFQFNASHDNPIYGRSEDVTPPTIVIKYYIKY
jgi:hypothetical protein